MRIERKQRGRTLPQKIAEGECVNRTFDGYHLTLHLLDSDGRELRVTLERHEAHREVEELAAIANKVIR